MEYAIHLLALFIALNFLLKVGFYPRWGMWTVAAGYAFFCVAGDSMDDGTVQDRGGSFLCLPSTDVELVGMCHSGSRRNDNFLFRLFRRNAYPQHGLQTSGHPLPEVIPRHTDRRSNMLCPGTAAFHFSRNRFRQSLMDSSRCYFLCSLCWEPSAAACYR